MENSGGSTKYGGKRQLSKPVQACMLTTVLLVAFITGVHFGILGPVLPDLALLTNTATTATSTIFTWRGAAAIVGSAMSPLLLDRLDGFLILTVLMFVQGAITIGIPWYPNLILVSVLIAIEGMLNSTITTATNFMGFKLLRWGKWTGVMAQAVRILHILGKGVAPFIAQPFLVTVAAPDIKVADLERGAPHCSLSLLKDSTYDDAINETLQDIPANMSQTQYFIAQNNQTEQKENDLMVQYAFVVLGGATALTAILSVVMFMCDGCYPWFNIEDAKKKSKGAVKGMNDSKLKKGTIICLFFLYSFAFSGVESTFNGIVMTFSTEYMFWTKAEGVLITSLYQIVKVGTALLTLPCAGSNPFFRHLYHATGMAISSILMVISLTLPSCGIMFWVASMLLGVSAAATTPATHSWLGAQYHIDGKLAAVLYTGFSIGQMAVPPLSTLLLSIYGPMAFPFSILACASLFFVLFVVIAILTRNRKNTFKEEDKADEKKPLIENKDTDI